MKKLLAFVIAVCMLLCVCPVAFAEQPLKYVVIGDSIAAGSGVLNSENACYGKIVADTNGYDYMNYGVPGDRSQDLLEIIKRTDVLTSLADADIISISIGGNDFLQQDLPKLIALAAVGDYHHLENIERDLTENLGEIVGLIRENNPDALIMLQSLYNTHIGVLGAVYDLAIPRVNAAVNAVYDEYADGNILIVDLASDFENHPEYVALDTIHPTAVGNIRIAEIILDTLAQRGLGVTSAEIAVNVTGIDEIPYSSYIIKAILDFFRNIFVH